MMIKHGMALKGSRDLVLVTGNGNESDSVEQWSFPSASHLQSFT